MNKDIYRYVVTFSLERDNYSKHYHLVKRILNCDLEDMGDVIHVLALSPKEYTIVLRVPEDAIFMIAMSFTYTSIKKMKNA